MSTTESRDNGEFNRDAEPVEDRRVEDRRDTDRLDDPAVVERRRDTMAAAHGTALQAEREQFGGMKLGSAFFGWLTAMGMGVILTAILAAAGTAVGVTKGADASQVSTQASQNVASVGIIGAIVLAVIVFLSYFAGGYVAGRMARFNGARQGVAVWLWALVVAILVAVAGAIAGSKYDVLSRLNGFPRIPVSQGTLSTAGIVALVLVAVTSLVGAILGGLAGMRYHRRVDRAGFEAI